VSSSAFDVNVCKACESTADRFSAKLTDFRTRLGTSGGAAIFSEEDVPLVEDMKLQTLE
jgi:hypothetical protein